MESKRKSVYITIFVITTIIASCAAVYFYLKSNSSKVVTQTEENRVASQENKTSTNIDIAKEEVKEKVVYKNIIPELDPNKCIEGSKDGKYYYHFIFNVFEPFSTAYLKEDKKSIVIGLNLNDINKYYGFNKTSNDFGSTIELKFDTDVVDVCSASVSSQAVGYEVLLVLLKDGTVEYVPLYEAIKNNNIKSYGKIDGITDIVRIGKVSFSGNDGYGHISPCAIKADGSFYDLFERLFKVIHPFN